VETAVDCRLCVAYRGGTHSLWLQYRCRQLVREKEEDCYIKLTPSQIC